LRPPFFAAGRAPAGLPGPPAGLPGTATAPGRAAAGIVAPAAVLGPPFATAGGAAAGFSAGGCTAFGAVFGAGFSAAFFGLALSLTLLLTWAFGFGFGRCALARAGRPVLLREVGIVSPKAGTSRDASAWRENFPRLKGLEGPPTEGVYHTLTTFESFFCAASSSSLT
jgi:hypothetical protein